MSSLFLMLTLFSCQPKANQSIEQKRFDKILHQSNVSFPKEGRYSFILWNENSCPSCKKTSADILRAARDKHITLIAPPTDGGFLQSTDSQFVFIDTARLFQKYYFGVSNVGLLVLKDGQTVSIKNYNTDEMGLLEKDLDSLQKK